MSTIRPLVAGNWKMNLDHVEAIHLTQQIGVLLRTVAHDHVDVMVVPPSVDLRSVTSVVDADRLPLLVGAQHASQYDAGAYTGEISVAMLRRLGVKAVLVGHSERRQLFAMSNETVATTVDALLRGSLLPIVCVGESEEIRNAEIHLEYVAEQVQSALVRVSDGAVAIAYEPIWAIGTGASASSEQIAEMVAVIRAALPDTLRATTPVLYGGSVKASNSLQIAREGAVDGFLIGGASLKAEEFIEIVAAANECYGKTR